MKKKIAYDNKRVYKKTLISQEEFDKITEEAVVAEELLNKDRFKFIREILLSAQEYAQTSIVENTIMDVSEEVTVSDRIKKIFTQPKKVQVDELSGQYKLVKKFFDELQGYVNIKASIDNQIAIGTVVVDE